MAQRTNTICFPFPANTSSLAAATRLDFAAIILRVPHRISRTFRSVIVRVRCRDNLAAAASMTSHLVGVKLGAVAFNDVTNTVTLTNTGDHMDFIFTRAALSYFNTNFGSLTEQTFQVGVQFGGIATLPISVSVILTYEYDDTLLQDSGTANSGAASTLTDTDKSWTTDAFKGWYVKTTGGTGSGQWRRITTNSGTVLTITPNWSVNPDGTTTYEIYQPGIKTAGFPLDSSTAALTNTLAEIGTNQVPNLDNLLPEPDKNYAQKWFESYYNDGGNATTTYNLALALDAEGEVSRGVLNQALNTAVSGMDIWVRNDMTTNATHAFKARSNNVTTRFCPLATVLFVTYEYNLARAIQEDTNVLNALEILVSGDTGYGTVSGTPRRVRKTLYIEEPGTISLVQSGILCSLNETVTVTFTFDCGAQSSRTYTMTAGSLQAGPYYVAHRLDSGGATGSNSFTIGRGKVDIDIEWYVSSASAGGGYSFKLFLNYTSKIAAAGEGAHNHTTCWSVFESTNATTTQRLTTPTDVVNIPETNWFKNAAGFEVLGCFFGDTTYGIGIEGEVLSGEIPDEGWREFWSPVVKTEGEFQPVESWLDDRDEYQRWAGDPDANKLALETSRNYTVNSGPNGCLVLIEYVTYHSITKTVSGTVRGYTGDGSGITVRLFRDSDKEYLLTTTTAAGGTFSFTWYDDTEDVLCEAFLDDNRVGRSKSDVAGSGFDIYISPMLVYAGMTGGMRG